MASRLAAARQSPDECFKALLNRRSRPCIFLLDVDLNIAFADPHASALIEATFGYRQKGAFPPALRDSIEDVIRRRDDDGALPENVIGPIDGLVLRVVPLEGSLGSFYAIFAEKEARREDLTEAVNQFSLSPREIEVLELILDGRNAAEIAAALHIAEVTVFDHFKHISQKTDARNRGDMLAKIFNWQADLTGKGPRPHT
jgi:DNA-binding CsgD family transcriptional regulator